MANRGIGRDAGGDESGFDGAASGEHPLRGKKVRHGSDARYVRVDASDGETGVPQCHGRFPPFPRPTPRLLGCTGHSS